MGTVKQTKKQQTDTTSNNGCLYPLSIFIGINDLHQWLNKWKIVI